MMREVLTKREARERGLKRYYTGKPCKNAHVDERFVSTSHCVVCANASSAKWKRENREKATETSRKWRQANPDKVKENKARAHKKNPEAQARRSRRWYEANKEKALENHYKWAKRNRATVNAAAARYRASKLQATPSWADHEAIAEFYSEAQEMSAASGSDYHVDHIIPLQGENICGLHVETNLQILCATVNRSKGNRLPEDCTP